MNIVQFLYCHAIAKFWKKNHSNQVTFKTCRGCTDALVHIDYYVTISLPCRSHVSILSIDFENAFNRIGLHVILNILSNWVAGPKIFNYIKQRKFRVKVNGVCSSVHTLYNGIPKGSPLSVILFSIVFNDINRIISKFKFSY